MKKINQSLFVTHNFLKVISNRNRLLILKFLGKDKKCVCEIWQYLDLPQNLISHHLKILKDAGLISSKKEGLKVIYWINQKNLTQSLKLINNLFNYV